MYNSYMGYNLKKFLLFLLILSLFFSAGSKSFAIENTQTENEDQEEEIFKDRVVKNGDTLSVIDCVSVAFHNSPLIKKYKYNLDIAKSNLGIAKSEYFPVIGAGVGFYNENNSNNRDYHSHYQELPSVAVTINKLVYNFGKTTAYIKMEEFYKIGAEYEFMDSLCRTLFDVKEKYYSLLLSESRLKTAQFNVKLCENILKQARLFAKTDKNRQADVKNAELNLSEAEINLIEAENNYKNAKIDLNNSMYIDSPPEYNITKTPTFTYDDKFISNAELKDFVIKDLPFSAADAVDIAYNNSPDLKVLLSTQKAMEQSLVYIKRTYFPDLMVNAGYGYNSTNVTRSDSSFSVGVSLNSSLNLMNLRHSIKGADAQVNIAENEISLFKKDLYFQVKRALNNLEKAASNIPIAQLKTSQAYTSLKVVDEDYKNKKTDYVAMQVARENYINTLNEYVMFLYEYNTALIGVEQAMHCHIIDIHHKSEHAVHYHSDELIEHISRWMNCDEKEQKHNRKRLGL